MTPRELAEYLQISKKEAKGKIQQMIDKAATSCELRAKQECPVDTGNLRASIHTDKGQLKDIVGTDVEYASFVEFGTSRQKAKPYMQPAAQEANRILKEQTEKLKVFK